MSSYRAEFSKTGTARYMSHLDLMRTMQRVFIRGGLSIKHTQGFNPHPHMVFALPLSVGCDSVCELMDFELLDDEAPEKIKAVLNKTFPDGIKVLSVYKPERKFKDIVWLAVEGQYEYDSGIDDEKLDALEAFYGREQIIITRKTKRGFGDADIRPNIYSLTLKREAPDTVRIDAVIAAQNPSLNPEHLVNALRQLAPELAPDFALFKRKAFLDKDLHIFK